MWPTHKSSSPLAVTAWISLLVLLTSIPTPGFAGGVEDDQSVPNALDYLHGCQRLDGGFGEVGEESTPILTRMAVLAIAAAGENPENWTKGARSPLEYLAGTVQGSSPAAKAQLLLALQAAGQDPRSFAGSDLVEGVFASFKDGQFGDPEHLVDDFWAIRALSDVLSYQEQLTQAAGVVINARNDNGGWSWRRGLNSDPDTTGMAILALASTGVGIESPVIQNGLLWLKGALERAQHNLTPQLNSPVLAMRVQALTALGLNPQEWQGEDLLAQLRALQLSDGSFSWTAKTRSLACWNTAAAIPALSDHPLAERPPTTLSAVVRSGSDESALVEVAESVEVHVRIEGVDQMLWEGQVLVEPTEYSLNDGRQNRTTRPNVLGAGILALRAAELPFEISGDYGDEIYTVNGHRPYTWFYRVNHSESELCQIIHPLAAGDALLLFTGLRADQALRVRVLEDPTDEKPPRVVAEAFDTESRDWAEAPEATVHIETSAGEAEEESRKAEPLNAYRIYAEGKGYVRSEVLLVPVPGQGGSHRMWLYSGLGLLALTLVLLGRKHLS